MSGLLGLLARLLVVKELNLDREVVLKKVNVTVMHFRHSHVPDQMVLALAVHGLNGLLGMLVQPDVVKVFDRDQENVPKKVNVKGNQSKDNYALGLMAIAPKVAR